LADSYKKETGKQLLIRIVLEMVNDSNVDEMNSSKISRIFPKANIRAVSLHPIGDPSVQ